MRRPWRVGPAVLLGAALFLVAPARSTGAVALRFLRDDSEVSRLDLDALRRGCGEKTITVDDPYYERRVRYLACPLRAVIRLGFGQDGAALAGNGIVFHALGGYAEQDSVARVVE